MNPPTAVMPTSTNDASRAKQALYQVLGIIFVGLALIGTVLPLLPTTPFLILASSCFMRSNPALQRCLMRLPLWGQILRDWETKRAVNTHTKRAAYFMIGTAISISVFVGQLSLPSILVLLGLATIGLAAIWRLPVIAPTTQLQIHKLPITRQIGTPESISVPIEQLNTSCEPACSVIPRSFDSQETDRMQESCPKSDDQSILEFQALIRKMKSNDRWHAGDAFRIATFRRFDNETKSQSVVFDDLETAVSRTATELRQIK